MANKGHVAAFRRELRPEDPANIRQLARATGFFHEEEIDIAGQLAEQRLEQGEASGYFFLFAEEGGDLQGYACFGPIPGTRTSFDLYWIVVHPRLQGQGLGARLMRAVEAQAGELGGTRIYIDTSQRPQYAPTRAFYERCGYRLEALLEHFYAPFEAKAIYCKSWRTPIDNNPAVKS